jgi:methylated-DNA-[protein]-cysteine S-methyltransferase
MPVYGFFQPVELFPIFVGVGERGISVLAVGRPPAGAEWVRDDRDPLVVEACGQLREYFEGRRMRFDLPLDLRGTRFQHRVWEALRAIPYGETRSYAAVAAQVGKPRAVRAVGGANAANPVAIIVPCHRVIAAGGGLGGYGFGLERKRFLLDLERAASTAASNSSARSTSA